MLVYFVRIAGAELEADHPGFHDAEYRERRRMIVHNASTYKHGMERSKHGQMIVCELLDD